MLVFDEKKKKLLKYSFSNYKNIIQNCNEFRF